MKWDNLTMSQKQALMKIYVNNGITNLDDIRNHYNSFSKGGKKEKPKSNDRKSLYDNYILEGDTIKERLSTYRPAPALMTAVRNTRKNRFDDGGYTDEYTLTDIIEGKSYLEYLREKYKNVEPSPDNSKLTASDVTNTINRNIKSTTEGLSKTAQQVVKDKEEKIAEDIYNYKLMSNSIATAAELAAAGYTLGRGLKALNIAPNSRMLNGRYLADSNQILMNSLGTGADAYQLFTATADKEKIENGLELTGDVAGIIGGTNWFRNTPFFGRYGNYIDTALDIAGYGAAAYDGLIKPGIGIYNWLTKDSDDEESNKKKYGGKLKKNKK